MKRFRVMSLLCQEKEMIFRKATLGDIHDIMNIIVKAQTYFREQGIDQWQNGYPNDQIIKDDINDGNSYVLLVNDIILGTAAILFGIEKTYEVIYNGKWLSDGEYATLHRIAIDSNFWGLGLASTILRKAEKLCIENNINSLRVDTHEDNLPMQGLLKKNGYNYCGIIYLEDGSKRLAYEKMWERSQSAP
jgi:ribosomal protein S18 acetylase RimI-like enzyme